MPTYAHRPYIVLWLLAAACSTPGPSAHLPSTYLPRGSARSDEVAKPPRCRPRFADRAGDATRTAEFAWRVQQTLALRYPMRMAGDASPGESPPSVRDGIEFVLVEKRWGADGPVPWVEVRSAELERFFAPVSLYRTEFATGELEYPWVAGLVLAKTAGDAIDLEVLLDPDFTDSANTLTSFAKGACAPAEASEPELAHAIATLYALGFPARVTQPLREGSCLISELHLYQDDIWRHVATDFDPTGVVRGVHAFNPKDDADGALRATTCLGR